MDYHQLNQLQREQIDRLLDPDYVMKWEDPGFMDIIMGKLPTIRYSAKEKNAEKEIFDLRSLLTSYNAFTADKDQFLRAVHSKIASIHAKEKYWFGANEYEIEECVRRHEFCLISGEGGIGKSFFIRTFEDNLEAEKIPHLCLYGKFEKDISNLDIENIVENSSQGFVFIVDAINEMSEEGQRSLLSFLSEIKKHPTIRVLLTYRTNSMNQDILNQYRELTKSEYSFPGISFESALDILLKLPIPDSQRYEDILYSNNALLLNMLKTVLQHSKVTDETEKGIASITYILEQYIKRATPKIQRDCVGRQIWLDTKKIAHWMYVHEKVVIDQQTLLSLITTGPKYISVMSQLGFLAFYERESETHFYFAIELLMNFLIARSLIQDIQCKNFSEQVEIIKQKTQNMHNLEEAITIAVFDAFSIKQGYEYIKKLLSETGLIQKIPCSTFVKVHYETERIPDFLKVFIPTAPQLLLEEFGGYTNKPFNCTNFLRGHFLKDKQTQVSLSTILEGAHFHNRIKIRLKNILYVITLDKQTNREEESYNFAILCSAAPNKKIRCLAMKILFTLCIKNSRYLNYLIDDYQKFPDHYIKESIIFVLSQTEHSNSTVTAFFTYLIHEESELTAKSIKRIAKYLGNQYGYIEWTRKDLYHYVPNATISDFLKKIIRTVSLRNKYILPFDYWEKDDARFYIEFLKEDKQVIHSINSFLEEKYPCIRTGKCLGSITFEEHIKDEISEFYDSSILDHTSLLYSLDLIMNSVFTTYKVTDPPEDIQDFENSLYVKCVTIAIELLYGSLMCNYYTNRFATYNNRQESIGYDVYDPLEYGEEIHLASPIPVYQDFVERLNRLALNHIELPETKDPAWVINVDLTRRNILNLLKPLKTKEGTWILLAGRISLNKHNEYKAVWKDTYNIWCCTSENETIHADDHARYLTIELPEYDGVLSSYKNCSEKSWLCKSVNSLTNNSDILDDTNLILPPAEIIRSLELSVDISDMSWSDSSHNKVIICNNNKTSYFRDPASGTVFIRKDFLERYLGQHRIKFFAFAERYTQETGFSNETSLHFEIQDGQIIKEIPNYQKTASASSSYNLLCDNCPFGFKEEEKDIVGIMSKFQALLDLYSDTSDDADNLSFETE